MKTNFIPVEDSFKKWKKDSRYVAAYDALEEESALASAKIKRKAHTEMPRPGLSRPTSAEN